MAFTIPLGQYVPGKSLIHNMDARVKILVVIAYLFAVFACSSWIGIGICAALLVAGYLIARVPLRLSVRGLRPIFYILIFTLVINMFTFNAVTEAARGDIGVIPLIGSFGFTLEGFTRGMFFALRILFLTSMTSLLTYTSTMLELADAITSLLSPLKRFKVPVEDISVIFTITLRFIPLTVEEADKIKTAQEARGVKFDEGGPIKRAKAWIPVITPLFVNLFRRADKLAAAMETRCYTSEGRTHRRSMKLKLSDIILGTLLCLAFINLGIFG